MRGLVITFSNYFFNCAYIVKEVIKLLGSGQAWSPGQGHQVVRKC